MLTLRTSLTSPSRSRGSESAGVLASNAPSQALVCFYGKWQFEVGTHAEAEHMVASFASAGGNANTHQNEEDRSTPNRRSNPQSRTCGLDEPLAPLRFGHHAAVVA